MILFLISNSFADRLSVEQIAAPLDITVNNEIQSFSAQTGTINILIDLKNPSDEKLLIYIMRKENNELILIEPLDTLDSYSSTIINLTLKVSYPKKTERNTIYAIVGQNSQGEYKGQFFTIKENWGPYEQTISQSIAKAHLFIVPLIGLLIILIFILIIEAAHKRHIVGLVGEEYTDKSLFFPKLKGCGFSERIADVILNPFFWLTEILLISILILFIFESNVDKLGEAMGSQVFLISGLAALLFPIIYFSIAWILEQQGERKPLRFFWSLFILGMSAAFVSFIFNSLINEQVRLNLPGETEITLVLISAAIVAPIVEEIAKFGGTFIMAGHHEFDDALTGLLMGFTIGVGFSFIENWFYFASKADPFSLGFIAWIELIVYRSFFNSIAHGVFIGLGSALIGHIKSKQGINKYVKLSFLSALLLAIPLHSVFNLSALLDGNLRTMEIEYGLPFIFNPGFVVILVILFIITYIITLKQRQKRIKLNKRHNHNYNKNTNVRRRIKHATTN